VNPRAGAAAAGASAILALPVLTAGVGSSAETSATEPLAATPPDSAVAFWRAKARKRLKGWDRANRRIVELRLRLKRLRARAPRALPRGRVALYVPHLSAWLCIHRYEGSWTDPNDPYWGGLQMDRSFMQTYAPRWLLAKGWANSWSPREQMWVAERAWRTRGFQPWPNTARQCGLL